MHEEYDERVVSTLEMAHIQFSYFDRTNFRDWKVK